MVHFAITGVAGYVAPRHLRAIYETGNRLVAAVDPHDSVGVLDQFFPDAAFFTEIERFDRHLEKLRRTPAGAQVEVVSVCSPNHLHDAHVRLALRVGADAICEKPLVLNPWNLDVLEALEAEYGRRIYTVLQLRVHPVLVALRDRLRAEAAEGNGRRHRVRLSYVTARGTWYRYSWKGDVQRSGGVATNIGIHFFDLLMWLFGRPVRSAVHVSERDRIGGSLELERADVQWFLSIEEADLPEAVRGHRPTYRSITVDGEEVEFSGGFRDLHTRVYEETLAGRGFGIEDARPSIELVHALRTAPVVAAPADAHPLVLGADRVRELPGVTIHESAYVDAPAEIGEGTAIWHFCHVQAGARIGRGCSLGQNVNVGAGVVIGDRVKIQNNVSVYTGCVVEDDVFLGPSCVLTNVTNPRSQVSRRGLYERTLLRRGATVGANATLVCGITLGRYAFVAAGSVVTKDVPDYALVAGNPARPMGWMSRHGHRLALDAAGEATCPESGFRYRLDGGTLRCLDLDEDAPLPPALATGERPYDDFKTSYVAQHKNARGGR